MQWITTRKLTVSAIQRNDLKELLIMIKESKLSKAVDAVPIAMLTLIILDLLVSLFISIFVSF